MKGSSENPSNIWIDAYKSVINQLNTYPNNIDLIDVDGSGENKLAVAEFSNMISIYKGTNVEWQYQLPDQPTAVGQFNQSTGKSRPVPILAVASDKYVYLTKNKEKYARLMLFAIDVDHAEYEIWQTYDGDFEGISTFLVALNDLKQSGVHLSPNSLNILMLETVEEQLQFYENARSVPNYLHDCATCMGAIYSELELPGSASQLVVATEFKWLLIANAAGTEFNTQFLLPETAVKLVTKGSLSKEHSIYLICRNNKLLHYSKEEIKATVSLEATPNDLARVEDNLVVCFFEGVIQIYSAGLLLLRSLSLKEPIYLLQNLYFEKLNATKGVAVVAGSELRIYDANCLYLVNSTKLDDEVVAMRFGKIGREEGCLFLLYKNKGIEIKILNRRLLATPELMSLGRPQKDRIEASGLKPPARSRIFAEQLEIDKEAVTSTYSKYQKDSLKMKIIVDEGYLRLLDQGMMSDGKKVKIHADVEGLGPVFKLRLDFTNQGLKPLTNLALALQFSSANYQLIESIPEVRCLLPSIMLSAVLRVKNVNPLGNNEDIKVFIMQRSQNHPIAGAVINMPVCDPQE